MSPTGILKINLDAVSSNWQFLSKLAPAAEVSAVIKANAYGVGAKVIADNLYKQGCRTFFVTTLDEAKDIKFVQENGAVIYVLGGVAAGDESIFVREKFIPVVYSREMLQRWTSYLIGNSLSFPVAIKIDTGMSRFGLQPEEFLNELQNLFNTKINLSLLMSHLACADEISHPLNAMQLERFKEVVKKTKAIFPSVKASLANSSGIFLGSEWHFDLVRPGAALYGINPQPQNANLLRSTISLKLPVLQVKKVNGNSTVGYAATASVSSDARLAVVAGGYADGVHRSLGYRPLGYCSGYQVQAIGRISMDCTIFDVSHLDSADEVIIAAGIEVIGEKITLDDLALRNQSLGYEILTSMGSRYQRHYVRD